MIVTPPETCQSLLIMSKLFQQNISALKNTPKIWLITGVAGFIGSNLLEALLKMNQKVVGLDNFMSGHNHNLIEVENSVSKTQWANFNFVEGDICDPATCHSAMAYRAQDLTQPLPVDFVLHHAASSSVPGSLDDPVSTNAININGFLNVLIAARDAGVKRLVYAASSSAYGEQAGLPIKEENRGEALSPYAVTKIVNELYAGVFAKNYNMEITGLRYFNVFGKRQDPQGSYAAVIPKWLSLILNREPVTIYGDGETTRDFCFMDNVVQANILAAMADNKNAVNQIYNIAVGERTSLNELHQLISSILTKHKMPDENVPDEFNMKPVYADFRIADIKHSVADISKAKQLLGYEPRYSVKQGLEETIAWYLGQHKKAD
jgi:UDP-N-acetylglucosamine 4-epimerase